MVGQGKHHAYGDFGLGIGGVRRLFAGTDARAGRVEQDAMPFEARPAGDTLGYGLEIGSSAGGT